MKIVENTHTLLDRARALPDDQLNELITCLEKERYDRLSIAQEAARREIERIAEQAGIAVTMSHKPADSAIQLRQGDIYRNPANHSQEYIVGNGRPPNWFVLLRADKRLPPPIGRTSLKRNVHAFRRAGDRGGEEKRCS